MDDQDDDDAARKATRGRTERATFPGPAPGIPSRHLPPAPRPIPRVPMIASEVEKTPPATPVAIARRDRAATLVGIGPDSVGARADRRPSLIPAPWDDTTENRVAAVKAGYRTAYVPSSPPPQPGYAEPAWWRSASGMVKVIGSTAAALVASTTAITAIIGAFRQPPAPPPASPVIDPCPPTVPPLQRSAFCVRFDQTQQAANTASADAADAKSIAARAERHADQIEEKIPKIKGLPKP